MQVRRRWTPALRLRTIVSSCSLGSALRSLASALLGALLDHGLRRVRRATKPVTYSLTAKQNYEKGLAELKDENYPEAQKYSSSSSRSTRSRSTPSGRAGARRLAVRARQLHGGDRQLQELRAPAPDAREGRGRLRRVPDRRELLQGHARRHLALPPSYEKDQSAVNDALRELNDFVKKFPDSKYLKKAEELRTEVLQRLVDHEV